MRVVRGPNLDEVVRDETWSTFLPPSSSRAGGYRPGGAGGVVVDEVLVVTVGGESTVGEV